MAYEWCEITWPVESDQQHQSESDVRFQDCQNSLHDPPHLISAHWLEVKDLMPYTKAEAQRSMGPHILHGCLLVNTGLCEQEAHMYCERHLRCRGWLVTASGDTYSNTKRKTQI